MRLFVLSTLFAASIALSLPLCKTVVQRVADGEIPKGLASALQSLVDSGPQEWVTVDGAKTGGMMYQRGVGGTPDFEMGNRSKRSPLHSGADDAFSILMGERNPAPIHVSVMRGIRDSLLYMEEVNRAFATPLAIRGKAKTVGLSKVTEAEVGSSATIEPGDLKPESIHSFGFFIPESPSDHQAYTWTSNYLRLMERLQGAGIAPAPNSRGAAFLQDLKAIWSSREWHYSYREGFGPKELRNFSTIATELRGVFTKYGTALPRGTSKK